MRMKMYQKEPMWYRHQRKKWPTLLLIATGSEVNLAVDAQKALEGEGISAAVISMPSWDRFDAQPQEYKDTVIPKNVKQD